MLHEARERARVRSDLYAAIALAFRKPEVAPDDEGGDSLGDLLLRAAELNGELAALAAQTVDALGVDAGQADKALRTLEIEYNRLFVGPAHPLAPPYESLYRDRGGLVMGPSVQAVLARYAEVGIALAPDHRDLPDHVAAELGFMAHLAAEEAAAEGNEALAWRQRAAAFLGLHLTVWLPQFCQRVREAGCHPFYPALADLAEAFVKWDAARLASPIDRGGLR